VVGSGLITILSLDTTRVGWTLYFLVCGVGTGFAINLPYTAVSTVLNETDMVAGNGQLSEGLGLYVVLLTVSEQH
jgi:hypothetical protein